MRIYFLPLIMLIGCNEAPTTANAPQQYTEKQQSENDEFLPVGTSPLARPKPWDFFENGRSANTYTLTYARDQRVCSTLLNALNQPRAAIRPTINNPRNSGNNAQTNGILSDMYFGTNISAKWSYLNTKMSYIPATIVDLDHDGTSEIILKKRNYDRYTDLMIDHIRYVPNPNLYTLTSVMPFPQEHKLGEATELLYYGRPSEYFAKNTVDHGKGTALGNMYNGIRLDVGQFIEILVIQEHGYIVLGGLTSRSIERNNSYAPVLPVRILKRGPQKNNPYTGTPYYTYKLVCELRQNFYDRESIDNSK